MDKSMLILVGPMDNVSSLLAALGCGIPSLPTSYLDLPMGVASKTVGWGSCSKRDYPWECLLVPSCARFGLYLEKFCIAFFGRFWRGVSFILLIGMWYAFPRGTTEGCLGIRMLNILISPCLGKWLWRFTTERGTVFHEWLLTCVGKRGWSSDLMRGSEPHVKEVQMGIRRPLGRELGRGSHGNVGGLP